MSDSSHGGPDADATPPTPPTPPPGFAGGPPIAPPPGTPPPGFAGGPPVGGAPQPNVVNPYTVPTPAERTPREPSKPAKRSIMPLVIGIIVVAALGGAAFWFVSSSDDEGDELASSGPGAAVLSLLSSLADRDYEAACEQLAAPAVERVTAGGETCEAGLERLNPGGLYDEADDSEILKVVTDGDRARVNVKIGGSPLGDLPIGVIREDGVWKTDLGSFGSDLEDPEAEQAEAETQAETAERADESDPSEDPGAGFIAWASAVRAKDWETACKFTASHTVQTWEEKGWNCLDTYAESDMTYPYINSDETTVTSTRKTKEDVAWVEAATSLNGKLVEDYEYRMQFEDGLWKYDSERTFG